MATNTNPVQRARASAGKSLEDVAIEVGVSTRTVRRWERGDTVPLGASLVRLARALGKRAEELVRVA